MAQFAENNLARKDLFYLVFSQHGMEKKKTFPIEKKIIGNGFYPIGNIVFDCLRLFRVECEMSRKSSEDTSKNSSF